MKIPSTNHAASAQLANLHSDISGKSGAPRAAGAGSGTPAAQAHPRLEAFAKRIETRFESALASRDLTPRQRAALEQERDRFHALLNRFQSAYLDGEHKGGRAAVQGMNKLLEQFSGTVNHILSGGAAHGGPSPVPGDAQGPIDSHRGIDTVG
jgi:hypothetical protein